MPARVNEEPTNVNSRNFHAAYSRRAPPQMPMSKNIGISSISQKRKNRKRSNDAKTPITPVSRKSINAI